MRTGPAPDKKPGGVGRHSPTAVPPRNGAGAGVKPSVPRQSKMPFAAVLPHAIPLVIPALVSCGSLAMAVSDTASRASNVLFWVGYSATNAVYAASTAAARREAPAGPAAGMCTGEYFRSMPFTASNTEAWTIAATRLMTSGEVPPTVPARSICWFQSVTSSALAIDDATRSIVKLSANTQNLFGSRMSDSNLEKEVSGDRAWQMLAKQKRALSGGGKRTYKK